jgi:hypothetical protein
MTAEELIKKLKRASMKSEILVHGTEGVKTHLLGVYEKRQAIWGLSEQDITLKDGAWIIKAVRNR